jgi:hypothetical protein
MKALVLLLTPRTLVDLTIQLDPPLPTIFTLHPSAYMSKQRNKEEKRKTMSYLCYFFPATSLRLLASL